MCRGPIVVHHFSTASRRQERARRQRLRGEDAGPGPGERGVPKAEPGIWYAQASPLMRIHNLHLVHDSCGQVCGSKLSVRRSKKHSCCCAPAQLRRRLQHACTNAHTSCSAAVPQCRGVAALVCRVRPCLAVYRRPLSAGSLRKSPLPAHFSLVAMRGTRAAAGAEAAGAAAAAAAFKPPMVAEAAGGAAAAAAAAGGAAAAAADVTDADGRPQKRAKKGAAAVQAAAALPDPVARAPGGVRAELAGEQDRSVSQVRTQTETCATALHARRRRAAGRAGM